MQLSPLQSRLAASLLASCLLLVLYFTLFSPHYPFSDSRAESGPRRTGHPVARGSFGLRQQPSQNTSSSSSSEGLRRGILPKMPTKLANWSRALELGEPSPAIYDDLDFSPNLAPRSKLDPSYEPEFAAFDRDILGRAPEGVTALTNNEAMPMNVLPGMTQLFVFTASSAPPREVSGVQVEPRDAHNSTGSRRSPSGGLDGRDVFSEGEESQPLTKRQTARTVFISANTCEQPRVVDPSKTKADPPQLTLYVSTATSNQSPGPLADDAEQIEVKFKEGAVMYNLTVSGEVYMGFHAPNTSSEFEGGYNFRVAASTDAYFFTFNETAEADLIWVDSDSQGALLITHNLTESRDPEVEQKIMSTQPYVMFAQNKDDRSVNGLKYSYCGLQNHAQIAATKGGQLTSMVTTGMTKRGQGNLPKQQFFFTGLNASANYMGILAVEGNASVSGNGQAGGGGHVFRATDFSTKSDHGNCRIVLNLEFCDQVAYSVPSNPNFGNSTQLAKFYDDYAAEMYRNFNRSLQQVACEAPSTQRYSLARNCTDCAVAYKDWLCSVTIPRCEDFDNPAPYLQPRAMAQTFPNGDPLDDAIRKQVLLADTWAFNSSRNARIDEIIKPGPYKEVLPCDDLCYNIVQSCPAKMKFSCPLPGGIGFDHNYARRIPSGDGGGLTCNYPGSAHVLSAAPTAGVPLWQTVGQAVVFGLLLLL